MDVLRLSKVAIWRNTLSNELVAILAGLGAILLTAGWRLLDLLLPKGRIFKWIDDNTVEVSHEGEDDENCLP